MIDELDKDFFISTLDEFHDSDRFWLEIVCLIKKEGHSKISGYYMLKAAGFESPLSWELRETMEEALSSMCKITDTWAAIDILDEEMTRTKSRRSKLASAVSLRRVINANLSILILSNNAIDFIVKLNANTIKEPFLAPLPTRYADDNRQLINATVEDFVFHSAGRTTIEHKRMWRYITRRLSDGGAITTIVFEDMFRNVEMSVNPQKRKTTLAVLKKMLKERKANGDEYLALLKESKCRLLSAEESERLEKLSSKKLVKNYKLNLNEGENKSLTIELL